MKKETAVDLSWKYFEIHVQHRTRMLNFLLVAAAATFAVVSRPGLVGGLGMNGPMLISMAAAVVTTAFFALDIITLRKILNSKEVLSGLIASDFPAVAALYGHVGWKRLDEGWVGVGLGGLISRDPFWTTLVEAGIAGSFVGTALGPFHPWGGIVAGVSWFSVLFAIAWRTSIRWTSSSGLHTVVENGGAVIFDCDGVLVDSEPIAVEVLRLHFKEEGLDLTRQDVWHEFVGVSNRRASRRAEELLGRELPSDFFPDFEAAKVAAFQKRLEAMRGVERVIELLEREGTAFCVATNGSRALLDQKLKITGLARYFPASLRFSAEEVQAGKPAPDLFLHAARQLGKTVEQCLVVEDTSSGIEAAKAAEMLGVHYGVDKSVYKNDPQVVVCPNMRILRRRLKG